MLGPGGNILVDYGVKELFAKVVLANRAVAKPFAVPDRYVEAVKAYAADAPEDGKILLQALKRSRATTAAGSSTSRAAPRR